MNKIIEQTNECPANTKTVDTRVIALVNSLQPRSDEERSMMTWMAEQVQQEKTGNPFPVSFDEAWKRLGCSKKEHAKRSLTALKLDESQFEIQYFAWNGDRLNPLEITIPKHGESKQGASSVSNPQAKWYREEIFLSVDGFDEFAMTVNKSARRVFARLKKGVFELGAAIQRGEVELKRIASDDSRPTKRLKACESQKSLTAALKSNGVGSGAVYGMINGETNKAVTGLYKSELAKELGLRGAQVNARNYMTKLQLSALELVELASAEVLNAEGFNGDPLEAHKAVLEAAISTEMRKRFLHGKRADKMDLRSVRMPVATAVTDVPPAVVAAPTCVQHATTIKNYFGVKSI